MVDPNKNSGNPAENLPSNYGHDPFFDVPLPEEDPELLREMEDIRPRLPGEVDIDPHDQRDIDLYVAAWGDHVLIDLLRQRQELNKSYHDENAMPDLEAKIAARRKYRDEVWRRLHPEPPSEGGQT